LIVSRGVELTVIALEVVDVALDTAADERHPFHPTQ
jgi:hypothetical protein